MSASPHEGTKKIGRPKKVAEERKSETLRFRVREALKIRVAAAAAESGRSLSEEAEFMLERFFDYEVILKVIMAQENARELLIAIAELIKNIQKHESAPNHPVGIDDWNGNGPLCEWTRSALRAGLGVIIEHSIPCPRSFEQTEWSSHAKYPEEVKRQYAQTMQYMHEIGTEFGRILTGQHSEFEEFLLKNSNSVTRPLSST